MSHEFICHVVHFARDRGVNDEVKRIIVKLESLANRVHTGNVYSNSRG